MRSPTLLIRLAHVLLVIAASCALPGVASAQVETTASDVAVRAERVAELRAQLAPNPDAKLVDDDRRIANAAFAVAEEELRELAPDVHAALAVCAERQSDDHGREACRGLLDALVVLGEQVPAPLLAATRHASEEAALVLVARDPGAHAELLTRMCDALSGRNQAVAASLLFRVDPRRVVSCLLRRVEFDNELAVRDGASSARDPERRRYFYWRAPNNGVSFAQYEIVRMPDDDAVAFDSGPLAFGWIRTAIEPYDEVASPNSDPATLVDLTNTFVAAAPGAKPFVRRSTRTVEVAALAAAVPAVRRDLDEQYASWNALLRAWHARGWISFAQTCGAAPSSFWVHDTRGDKSVPLPETRAELERWVAERRADPASFALPCDDAARVELRADLASDSTERVAWAAAAIASRKLAEFGPELRVALAHVDPETKESGARYAAYNLFDALICTRTALASDEFERWRRRGFQAQLLQLAPLDPESARAFLEAGFRRTGLGTAPGVEWVASCNVLARTLPARFVALALAERSFAIEARVFDDTDSPMHDQRMHRLSIGCGPGRLTPVAYPPIAEHELKWLGTDTREAFADGPLRIGVQRTAGKAFGGGCDSSYVCDMRLYRMALLCELAQVPSVVELDVRCTWSDAAALERDAKIARARVAADWSRVVDGLRARGFLTDETAAAARAVEFRVRVVDERRDRETPLPALELK